MNISNFNTVELASFVKSTELFSKLDEAALNYLCSKLEEIKLKADEVLMNAGDPGDCLYLIQKGKLCIVINDDQGKEVVVAEKESGESVGEIALLTGEKRSAKVRAASHSSLLRLAKSAFDELSNEYGPVFEQISQAIIYRLEHAQLQQVLHGSNLFDGLSEAALGDLEGELEVMMLRGGDYLVHEGGDSDSLHFILSGRLQVVTRQEDGSHKVWAELGRGQTVGEMGLLTGDKRSASVLALRDTLVAKLPQQSFLDLLVKYPEMMTKQFAGGIVSRLWKQLQGTSRDINTLSTFTVIPADEGTPLDVFCHSFTEALSQFGPTLYLNSDKLDDLLDKKGVSQTGYDDVSNVNVVRWLSEQETKHRFIVYQADNKATPWSQRCLRQADRILVVCQGNTTPRLGEVASLLNRENRRIDKSAVLFYEHRQQSPGETSAWLTEINCESHYHVRLYQQSDFGRLARILTGHSVGLVLSGGGARGFAHIGAIRALEEAGLEIDMVAGTSMGALMAAQCAMGWDAQTMLENSKEAIAKHNKMEYTLPVVSLLTGNAWGHFLLALYGETQIEDLWLNYFCCSTDLTDTELRIHERGSLWKSVRASSSIPGLVPPVYDNGSILVDGAVLNNMPVDIMQQRNNSGLVYAVDVGGGMNNTDINEFDPVLSGWKLFFRRKNNVPKMMSILMQSATMGGKLTKKLTQGMADLYINPAVGDYSILDFDTIEPIAEQGYRCAQKQIEQWMLERRAN